MFKRCSLFHFFDLLKLLGARAIFTFSYTPVLCPVGVHKGNYYPNDICMLIAASAPAMIAQAVLTTVSLDQEGKLHIIV